MKMSQEIQQIARKSYDHGRIFVVSAVKGRHRQLSKFHHLVADQLTHHDSVIYCGDTLMGGKPMLAVQELLQFRTWFMAKKPWVHQNQIIYLRGLSEEVFCKLFAIHTAPQPLEILEFALSQGMEALFHDFAINIKQFSELCAACSPEQQSIERLRLAEWSRTLRKLAVQSYGLLNYIEHLKSAVFFRRYLLCVNAGIDVHKNLWLQGDSFWTGGKNFHDKAMGYGGYKTIVRGRDHWLQAHQEPIFNPSLVTLDAESLCAVVFTKDKNPQIINI